MINKINNISYLFFSLILKKKYIFKIFKSQIILKSFIKNNENEIIKLLFNLNKLYSNKYLNSLYEICHSYKFLLFFLIQQYLKKKNNLNKYSYYYIKNINLINYVPFSLFFSILYKKKLFNFNFFFQLLLNYYLFTLISFIIIKFNYISTWNISRLPIKSYKFTILRSPHIDKRSREQFEIVTHKSVINGYGILEHEYISLIEKKINNYYFELHSINY